MWRLIIHLYGWFVKKFIGFWYNLIVGNYITHYSLTFYIIVKIKYIFMICGRILIFFLHVVIIEV